MGLTLAILKSRPGEAGVHECEGVPTLWVTWCEVWSFALWPIIKKQNKINVAGGQSGGGGKGGFCRDLILRGCSPRDLAALGIGTDHQSNHI